VTVIIYVNMKSHHSPLETGGHSGNRVEDISKQQIPELHSSPLNAHLECYWYTSHRTELPVGGMGVIEAQSMFAHCYRILNLEGCGTFPLF